MWEYQAEVVSVHDGDTFTLDLDLGVDVRTRQRVRLRGVDAPELATVEGRAAREKTRLLLPVGSSVVVQTEQTRARSVDREKYGRLLAAVTLPDGRDLAAALVAAGHAWPWTGRRP